MGNGVTELERLGCAMRVVAIVGFIVAAVVGLGARRGMAEPTTRPGKMEVVEIRIPRTVVSFKMVKIPAGTIEMAGKEGEKPRKVEIKGVWMGEREVTWDEYNVYDYGLDIDDTVKHGEELGVTRPSGRPYGEMGSNLRHNGFPASCITSRATAAYCRWLSGKTGRKFRLATEAEWEYACQAGNRVEQLDAGDLAKVAWYKANSANEDGDLRPHPVGKKEPNAWGLFDMLGNAAEWVTGSDGTPVVKGGSFKDPQDLINFRSRQPYDPKWQWIDPQDPKDKWWLSNGEHVGFRVVMEE